MACAASNDIDMMASAASVRNNLMEHIECPVCLETTGVPKVLPCGHTICEKCMSGLDLVRNNTVICPLCRHEVHLQRGKASSLPTNITMVQLRDAISHTTSQQQQNPCEYCGIAGNLVTHFCRECSEYFCWSCADDHSSSALYKDHSPTATTLIMCTDHKKPLTFFCTDCKILLCRVCIHRKVCDGHAIRDLREMKQDSTCEMNDLIDKLRIFIQIRRENIVPKKQTLQDLLLSIRQEKNKVKEHARNLTDYIRGRLTCLLAEADKHEAHLEAMLLVAENQEDAMVKLDKLKNTAEQANNGGIEQILLALPTLKSSIDSIQSEVSHGETGVHQPVPPKRIFKSEQSLELGTLDVEIDEDHSNIFMDPSLSDDYKELSIYDQLKSYNEYMTKRTTEHVLSRHDLLHGTPEMIEAAERRHLDLGSAALAALASSSSSEALAALASSSNSAALAALASLADFTPISHYGKSASEVEMPLPVPAKKKSKIKKKLSLDALREETSASASASESASASASDSDGCFEYWVINGKWRVKSEWISIYAEHLDMSLPEAARIIVNDFCSTDIEGDVTLSVENDADVDNGVMELNMCQFEKLAERLLSADVLTMEEQKLLLTDLSQGRRELLEAYAIRTTQRRKSLEERMGVSTRKPGKNKAKSSSPKLVRSGRRRSTSMEHALSEPTSLDSITPSITPSAIPGLPGISAIEELLSFPFEQLETVRHKDHLGWRGWQGAIVHSMDQTVLFLNNKGDVVVKYEMPNPWGLAYHRQHNAVLVANSGCNTLWKFYHGEITGVPSSDELCITLNSMDQVYGLSVMDNGNLVVTGKIKKGDNLHTAVGVYFMDGKQKHLWDITTKFASKNLNMEECQNVAVDTQGNIYLCLNLAPGILKLSRNGKWLDFWRTEGRPEGLTIHGDHLLLALSQMTVTSWNLHTGRLMNECIIPLDIKNERVQSVSIQGSTMAVISTRRVCLYNLQPLIV